MYGLIAAEHHLEPDDELRRRVLDVVTDAYRRRVVEVASGRQLDAIAGINGLSRRSLPGIGSREA